MVHMMSICTSSIMRMGVLVIFMLYFIWLSLRLQRRAAA